MDILNLVKIGIRIFMYCYPLIVVSIPYYFTDESLAYFQLRIGLVQNCLNFKLGVS